MGPTKTYKNNHFMIWDMLDFPGHAFFGKVPVNSEGPGSRPGPGPGPWPGPYGPEAHMGLPKWLAQMGTAHMGLPIWACPYGLAQMGTAHMGLAHMGSAHMGQYGHARLTKTFRS